MLAKFGGGVWTLVSLSAFVIVSRLCLAAPTSQRQDDTSSSADDDDAAAAAAAPAIIRIKRADEMIFNGNAQPAAAGPAAAPLHTSDDAAAASGAAAAAAKKESTPASDDDVTGPSDGSRPAEARSLSDADVMVPAAAANGDVQTQTHDDEAQNDDDSERQTSDVDEHSTHHGQDATEQADVATTSSDDSNKHAAAAAADDDDDGGGDASDDVDDGDAAGDSSLMLAENMAAAQHDEQKLRAKRDLDADEIRELFESQYAPADDYYAPDYTYNDVGSYEDDALERGVDDDSEVDDDDEEELGPWQQFDDYYDDDADGRPKRTEVEDYESDVEREAVRELLAERAAEEARQALVAYLTSGEPAYTVEEPRYAVEPVDDDLAAEEAEEYQDLVNGEDELPADLYDEEPELSAEKRYYPYSYEPYGGRWGALVPGAKRGDRDPYDRLYRLAEVLSRPSAQLTGTGVDDYRKK